MSNLQAEITQQVRTLQVIVGAIGVTPFVFAGITLAVETESLEADANSLLVKIALVVGLVGLFVQQLLGRLVMRQSVNAIGDSAAEEPTRLVGAYQSGLIVSCAICEGAAFVSLIAFMVTRDYLTLAMGLLLALAIAVRFPTVSGVMSWLETETRRLSDQRDLEAND